MRFAVIGAGGIGAPLGASLATAGHDVIFVARGAHRGEMRASGLRVEGDRGTTHVQPVQATDDPGMTGPVDVVLSCVKLWDLESSAGRIRPMIGPDTVVIPLQNGVDASERLVPILGARHVLGGVAMVTGSIVGPGVVRQTGKHHSISFGELDGQVSARSAGSRTPARPPGSTRWCPTISRSRAGTSSSAWSRSRACALSRGNPSVRCGAIRISRR